MIRDAILRFSPIRKFVIKDISMEPSILAGDQVLVTPFLKIQENDIVVFKYSGKYFIKRVIKIKHGEYYVLGDNKNHSLDSREFGFIARKDIIGKVISKL